MAEEEYVYEEPTNAQLANFLMVYAKQIPEMDKLKLSPPIMESLLSTTPRFREGALRHHKAFQEKLFEEDRKRQAGELRCQATFNENRVTKPCPNFNVPGTDFCTFHQPKEEENGSQNGG